MDKKFRLFTDGGSRGNPGPAAVGGILQSPEGLVAGSFKECIGISTNNKAEYTALIKGLGMSLRKNVKILTCYLDSELVVNQLNGQYKVKDADMKVLFEIVKSSLKKFEHVEFIHVARGHNKEADKLVNEALDSART